MPRGNAASAKPTDNLDRQTRTFMEKFEKTFGEGSIVLASKEVPYEFFSTGSIELDLALGIGGIMLGRLHEWWGIDGIGKTTFAMIAMAQAQIAYPGRWVGYIDAEHRLDRPWMKAHGVNMDRCMVHTPNSAEEVADALKDMLRSGLFSVVVLDSVAAMAPEVEFEKGAGDATVGLQPKIVTRMVKLAAVEAEKSNTAVIIINQVRANIAKYGVDTTTGGGWALKHSTTTKLRFRRGENAYKTKVLGQDIQVGHDVAIYVERNGVAPAYKTAIVALFNQDTARYGPLGIDRADEAATRGVKLGLIEQRGGWYTITSTGERVQGRDTLVETLRTQPDVVASLREQILASQAEFLEVEVRPEDIPDEEEPPKKGFRKGAAAAAPPVVDE